MLSYERHLLVAITLAVVIVLIVIAAVVFEIPIPLIGGSK